MTVVIKARNSGRREIPVYNVTSGTLQSVATPVVHTAHQSIDSYDNEWYAVQGYLRRGLITRSMVKDVGSNFRSQRVSVDVGLKPSVHRSNWYPSQQIYLRDTKTLIVPSSVVSDALVLYRSGDTPDAYGKRIIASTPTPRTDIDLNAAGATAISRCMPTNPVVDLATSLSETISARKLFSLPGNNKSLSGEYLNLQLGILPVISDVRDTYKAAQEAEATLKQYERDSGRLVRRRYAFPVQEEQTTVTTSNALPAYVGPTLANSYQVKPGVLTTTTRTVSRTWFSGAFTYYLPKYGWRRTLAERQRLYGIVPGSETAYNVVPYSFVADYFVNLGDVLHNVDAFSRDGLVMPYGYVMVSQEITIDQVWRGPVSNESGSLVERVVTATVSKSTKQRKRANPFGFGLAEGDLSLRQVSILAALGLNRR